MGSEDHMFLTSIRKIVSTQQSALLHVIENYGHVVNVERPEIFNNEALKFLNKVDKQSTDELSFDQVQMGGIS